MFKPGSYENYGNLVSINSPYTVKPREDLFNLLPKLFNPKSILEFGCGNGINLIYFGNKFNIPPEELFGVDICKSIDIKKNEFNFNHSSIEKFLILNNKKFDLIIFSDVLEHLYNPWDILEKVSCHLFRQGIILISVPNLQNIKYIDAITSGNFYYEKTGLFDQTHIRFFTLKSLFGYLQQQNFKIINNGWRPDISIQNIKENLIGYLNYQNNVNLKLTSCQLSISQENIEQYFGQQILIAAEINE